MRNLNYHSGFQGCLNSFEHESDFKPSTKHVIVLRFWPFFATFIVSIKWLCTTTTTISSVDEEVIRTNPRLILFSPYKPQHTSVL